jgi:putative transposase
MPYDIFKQIRNWFMLNDLSQRHQRKSIRLKGYDYAKEGLYFITICCQDRACLFGDVIGNENIPPKMILNDAGKIANECWLEIPAHFPNVKLHEFIIMPNHVHGIIEITYNDSAGAKHISSGGGNGMIGIAPAKHVSPLRGPSKTIGSMVRGFKIGVTKWMRQNTNVYDVWQRNYHEIIIRNEQSYQNISKYIINNPAKWAGDKFYKK